jgi:hypothetical protein
MPSFGEEETTRLLRSSGKKLPDASKLLQPLVAQPGHEHVVWARVLRVKLEAGTLKSLYHKGFFPHPMRGLGRNRIAKVNQTAILLPELSETPLNAVCNTRHIEA